MQSQADSAIVTIALLAIAGFLIWLVFFTGDGYKGILEDLKSLDQKKKERFPIPVFDRSKIDLPRPKKPRLQALTREPVNFNEKQFKNWVAQLQKSLVDLRKEAAELAKAYNSMPPSLVEDPSKPKRKRPAAKPKPAAKKPIAKKPVKKTAPKRTTSSKTTKKAAPKKKGR